MTEQSDQPALAANALKLRKVYVSHAGETVALHSITASFRAGQFTAVVGPSGAGKTTLFNCLTGLDRPSAGQVSVGNHAMGGLTQKEMTAMRRTELGMVLEQEDLIGSLSVAENLMLPSRLARHTPRPGWVDAVIDAAGLRDLLGASPARLNPSQQQRAAVARALITRPGILVADEPTGRLDTAASDELMGFLMWARTRWSQTLVVLTQNLLVAAQADRTLFLTDGRIVADLHSPTRFSVISKYAELSAAGGR